MKTLKNAVKWLTWGVAVVGLNVVLPAGVGLVAAFGLTAWITK